MVIEADWSRHCCPVYVCFGSRRERLPAVSAESEAAGAADAHRLFSRQGQLGDRKGENE